MRMVTIGRKNYSFVESQTGGRAAVIAHTLVETVKLNGIDLQAWSRPFQHTKSQN